jgi:alpha-tubulin suppressor-like RCC1 family protein
VSALVDAATPVDVGGRDVPARPDAAPVRSCLGDRDCPADEFCAMTRQACVPDVIQVAAGAHHSCALHRGGAVSCWGLAASINAGGDQVLAPIVVDIPPVSLLSAGTHQTCGLGLDGRVRCWGDRAFEVVRWDGTPLADAQLVSLGPRYGCAATRDGVYCWGKNELGQLARPLAFAESAEAQLAWTGSARVLGAGDAVVVQDGDRVCAWGSNGSKQIADDDLRTIFTEPHCFQDPGTFQIAVGSVHVCLLGGLSGGLTCWGERYYGQLGIGGTMDDTLDVPPPGQSAMVPAAIRLGVAGVSHTCVVSREGKVYCFGLNSKGQVGPNGSAGVDEVRLPVEVSGLSGSAASLGAGSSAQHTCAVLANGSVECWGNDSAGQLGDAPPARDDARFSAKPVTVRF